MNNYNFNNGQFSGSQQQNGQFNKYNTYYSGFNIGGFNPFAPPVNYIEKNNEKRQLKIMGNLFAMAVILFIALSFLFSLILGLLSIKFKSINVIFNDETATYAYEAIASILFILLPFALAYSILRKKQPVPQIPLGTVYNRKAAVCLVAIFVPVSLLTTIGINIISNIFQTIMGVDFTSGLEGQTIVGLPSFLMATLSMAVVPAITEEIAVRGIVMSSLRKYGDKFAIITSAMIFSLMHGNMVQIPYTLFAGIFFGYVAVKTGSIWPTIIMHFINNFYSVLSITAYDNFGDSTGNAVTMIMLGILIVCGIIGGAIYSGMNYKSQLSEGVKTLKTGEKLTALFLNLTMIIAILIMLILTALSVSSNG